MTKALCDYSYKNDGVVVLIQEKDRDNYGYNDLLVGKNSDKIDYKNITISTCIFKQYMCLFVFDIILNLYITKKNYKDSIIFLSYIIRGILI